MGVLKHGSPRMSEEILKIKSIPSISKEEHLLEDNCLSSYSVIMRSIFNQGSKQHTFESNYPEL